MHIRRLIKSNARKAISQNYVKTLSVTLILAGILLFFYTLVLLTDTVMELLNPLFSVSQLSLLRDWAYLFSPILVTISLLLELILFSPLVMGCVKWFYRFTGGETCDVVDLFDCFSSGKKYFGSVFMELGLFVRKLLWSLLFLAVPCTILTIGLLLLNKRWTPFTAPACAVMGMMLFIAGIVLSATGGIFLWIFTKRYFLVRYLYTSGGCNMRQAFKQSVYFTKEQRNKLFMFDLSFLGWMLSCVVLIPAFYVIPYYASSCALYAHVLTQQHQQNMEAEPPMETTREFAPPEEDAQ